MIDRDDSSSSSSGRGPRLAAGPDREQTGEAGDVTVPLVTGTSDGKGWKLGGPIGALIDLFRGK